MMVRSAATLCPRLRRTGGFFSVLLATALLALAGAPSPATAQQPTRPDTTRRPVPDTTRRPAPDTTRRPVPDTARRGPPPGAVPPDTGTARDSTRAASRDTTPPPQLPAIIRRPPAAFSTGVWVFTRDSIQRFTNAVTLADLLEMIPGITRVRSGYFVQPEAVSSLGQTGGRIEVFLDGYELQPVTAGVPDLTRIELAEVDNLRVERRVDALRIDVTSLSPTTYQPYAFIQAGVAEPNAKLFRGGFLAPKFLIGPFAFGVDRLDTNGTGGAEGGDATGAFLKWGKIWADRGGVQAEFRSNTVNRNQTVPWVGTYSRKDLVLRGRWRLMQGLVADAYFGNASVKDPNLVRDSASGFWTRFKPDLSKATSQADSIALLADTLLERSDRQIGARLNYDAPVFWGDAALRTHSAVRLPSVEGDVTGGLRFAGAGDVDVGVHLESWTDKQATDSRLRGRLGPFKGLSAFAELSSGERGVPFLRDTVGNHDLFSKRSAWRAGVDLDREWLSGGIARVSVNADSIPAFGLPFDQTSTFFPAGKMTGWESHARVRLFWKPLSAEYWYLAWTEFVVPTGAEGVRQPIYTPDQEYRFSLIYHQLPLSSGHLELYARLDARSRGNVYNAVAPATVVPAANSIDFFLQIRILDLRMFFQEVGMTAKQGQRPFDITGRPYPAPRIYYGVRWQFFD